MLLRKRLAAVLVAWVGGLVAAPLARAQVKDDAHLFQPPAIRTADLRIDEMRGRFNKTLLIETFSAPPTERVKAVNLGDAKMRAALFDKWVAERVQQTKLNGIYVLICVQPEHVHVAVSPEDNEELFTERNQEFLQGHLLRALRKRRRIDDGLIVAVNYVGGKLESNEPVDWSRWLEGMSAVGGVVCFWVLLVTVRARLRKHTPSGAGVRIEDESGRSIAVLGGGIGAVSGQWLFDRLTRRHPLAAPATENEATPSLHAEHFPEEP